MENQNTNVFRITSICLTILFLGLMSASITHAETYNANIVSVNYQYQAWGQYSLIDIFGEKYVPLESTEASKLAKLVLDSDDTHILGTGEKLDLGSGYTLVAKQVDVDDKKVWLEFDKDGVYIDDKVVSTNTGQDHNWTCLLDHVLSENNVPVFKVHVNNIYQGAVQSFATIDGVWLIDYQNGITLYPDEQIGSYTIDSINGGNVVYHSSTPSLVPVAAFSASPTSGSIPLKVQFTDKSTNNPTSWKWDFGDGTTSTTHNPLHTYIKAGSFTVTLTATNAAGSNTVSKSNYITVNPTPPSPVAAFTATPTSGTTPLKVQFTDKSTNNPTSWLWKFGDGTTSTAQNPTHTYSKAGKYTVSLTVTNAAGSNSVTKSNYIVVTALKPPVAAFKATPLSGKKPLTVSFTDQSTNNPTSWSWVFGDGTSSTTKNPVHKYTKAGTYTVKLTVKNAAGSSSVTKSKYITVK